MNQAEHRPENFCVGEIAGGGNVIENRGLHEVTGFVFRNLRVATIDQHFRALFFTEANQ